MTEPKLPPLPETSNLLGIAGDGYGSEDRCTNWHAWDEDAMRAYATEAERLGFQRGLEEAAKVCECKGFGRDAAAAIRALAQKEQTK
jgi:hypothetical protein